MPTKNKLDKVLFSYTTQNNQSEDENQTLKEYINRLEEELKRLKTPSLMVCEVHSVINKNQAIINIPNGNKFLCNIASDCEPLKPGDQVLVEQKNLNIIKKSPLTKKFSVEQYVIIEKPKQTWSQVGGLQDTILEVKEVIELPLLKPQLFKKVGITPPKGILLHGPPGTGKTLLAKAVANSTHATFIEVVASELVQKFIGEGAKLVKEIFELARKKAPAIIFIDELDALAGKRMEIGTSGEREVNRTFMQLLAELDGFKPLGNVKIIGATNRKDILDPAILRPGRLDRLIHVDVPNEQGRLEIFKIHTQSMKLNKSIDLKKIIKLMDEFAGAEIRAVATEAGYFAIRENRITIKKQDLLKAIDKVKQKHDLEEDMSFFG
ncbi:MAG: AAA family ATPase [Nanoarchaeota archaeon]|nr:AAA family ATPase [Nanoarchaeota archaeon]